MQQGSDLQFVCGPNVLGIGHWRGIGIGIGLSSVGSLVLFMAINKGHFKWAFGSLSWLLHPPKTLFLRLSRSNKIPETVQI